MSELALPSRSRELALPLLFGGVQLALLSTGGADPLRDDAFISLRYADNLVSGHGLVFNPGEQVEGFTNPLWTLLGALILWLGLPAVSTLKAVGGLCYLGLIASGWRAALDAGLPAAARMAVAWVLAGSVVLAYWSLSGLETVPFAWAVLEGTRCFAAAAREGRACSASGALLLSVATLLRPEAAAFVVLLGSATLGLSLRRAGLPDWRAIAVPAGLYLLPVLAWQAVRLSYYGDWLPNTFYAKVSGGSGILGRGLSYLADGLLETPLLALLLGIVLAPSGLRRPLAGLAALLAAFHLAYVVKVGGDFMGVSRFLVPVLPLVVLAWATALSERRAALLATGAAALLLGLLPYLTQDLHREHDGHLRRYTRAAEWLDGNIPQDALVASSGIGVLGYVTGRPILDMNGLIDREVARYEPDRWELSGPPGHDRAHPDYVFARKPDIILVANIWLRPVPLTPESLAANQDLLFPTERFLFGMPGFFEAYDLVNWQLDGGDWIGLAARIDSPSHPRHPDYAGPAVGPVFER